MRRLLGLPAIALCVACQTDGGPNAAAVREIIDRHNTNLQRWYAAGHIDSAAVVFAEDVWQMPPNAAPLVGRQAYRDFWTTATQEWGAWEFDLEVQDVVVSGNIAVERGKYTLGFTAGSGAPDGMTSFDARGNYVVLWRQEEDGEWRVVWDAPVSELPPLGAS